MDGLRLPPLIEEALDSTGLCAAVLSVCVHLRLRVAGYSRVAVFFFHYRLYRQRSAGEKVDG